MELFDELSNEPLPVLPETVRGILNIGANIDQNENISDLVTKAIVTLQERIDKGDNQALFSLGQVYFETKDYDKAKSYFERASEELGDLQATFQLGVIHYDGLGGYGDPKKGVSYMTRVAGATDKKLHRLICAAQYNVGRAYYQGIGVRHRDDLAECFWLKAADDGNPKGSVRAQSALGMFYSCKDYLDLKKAFFWHTEACANGNLESQGALGIMYLKGLGVKRSLDSALECFRRAAARGNVNAMGHMAEMYYKQKLFTKTVELAQRISMFENVKQTAEDTGCLPTYVAKGIAMACFYYARCLHLGRGVQKNVDEAHNYYSRSFRFDPDTCAQLQIAVQQSQI